MQAHTYVIISYHIRHTHRVMAGLISKKRERKKERKKKEQRKRKKDSLSTESCCLLIEFSECTITGGAVMLGCESI